ncbi:MAG: dienelactone hydrolase family protein [Clostridia bacterium]|nr:dienelactone hydrolase family protein [Clostridia bacterium]
MKRIKSFISLLLVAIIIFSFSSCIKLDFLKKDEENESTTVPSTVPYASDSNIVPDTQGETVVSDTVSETQTVTQPVTQTYNQQNTQSQQVQNTVTPQTTVSATQTVTSLITETGVATYSAEYSGRTQTVFYSQSIINSTSTYPVLVFANGTGFDYKLYENLLIEFAEGGYIVVANNETMAADGTAQIASLDFIISENSNSSSVLYKKINTEKAAAVGHSQGGRSAVNAAAKDSRFDCVLSLAGSNYTEEAELLSTPALFMAGTRDMIVNADKWVKPAYDVAKGPAVYVSLVNGVHTSCCNNPETYTVYAIQWFDIWLKNDTNAKATFRNGGTLANDSAWTEFSCKNI